jgi:glutathione S-transferase
MLADGRSWLAGDHLSLADLAAAAHLSAVDYAADVPWADYPATKAWYQRIKSRPSFRPLLADTVRGMTPSATYADLDF